MKQKIAEKEAEMLSYLNNNLKLLLDKGNVSKESVLNKIQELIAGKPPRELEREVTSLKVKIAELKNRDNFITKQTIIQKSEKIFRELGISSAALKTDNTSAEQVEEIRDNLIKNEFNKLKNGKSGAESLNIVLGILLFITLLVLIYTITEKFNSAKIGPKTKPKK